MERRLRWTAARHPAYLLPLPFAVVAATLLLGRPVHIFGSARPGGATKATEMEVASPLAGRLVSLAVRAGDAVRRGQPLAVVEPAAPGGTVTALEEFRLAARREELRRVREQDEAAQRRLQRARRRREAGVRSLPS